MFKTLIVPLDGSPQSAAALPLARTLAHVANGTLVLVRVTSGGQARDTQAEDYLRGVARELEADALQVRCVVSQGEPAHQVVSAARAHTADAIVMATHARTGLQRALLGSVAERVLHETAVPLVLVRPGGKRVTSLKTILVPTDGTAGAALALGAAVGLARASNARLVVVQAIEPVPLWVYSADYGAAPSYVDPAWEEEVGEAARTYVAGLVSRLQAAGLNAEGEAVPGKTVETIDQVADRADADLVVMSTHALSGPVRTLLGSTADAVVRTGRRPVVLVRRPAQLGYEARDSQTSVPAPDES